MHNGKLFAHVLECTTAKTAEKTRGLVPEFQSGIGF